MLPCLKILKLIPSNNDEDDENDVFAFLADNIQTSISSCIQTNNYYSELKPNFTKAVNWITTQDTIEDFVKIIDKFVSGIKKYILCENTLGKYMCVSSIISNREF